MNRRGKAGAASDRGNRAQQGRTCRKSVAEIMARRQVAVGMVRTVSEALMGAFVLYLAMLLVCI